MVVWIAWEPPLYTHSTSHSRWTRNQRATSMIFGRSTQNTCMKKRKPQKQGLTGLDFEINVKNCQKMSKNAKNRENWSFAMSCSSKTSMVRGGFFYIISKIMHERTTTENLVTIARWFFSNYKVALHLKFEKRTYNQLNCSPSSSLLSCPFCLSSFLSFPSLLDLWHWAGIAARSKLNKKYQHSTVHTHVSLAPCACIMQMFVKFWHTVILQIFGVVLISVNSVANNFTEFKTTPKGKK